MHREDWEFGDASKNFKTDEPVELLRATRTQLLLLDRGTKKPE